ncbi:hypothetical protein [Streptomyces sp. or20]|uniref:hypothetical protein n=1 Tax=Streptomyces sp. or20 TaxID=1828016 RepID=UPI00211D9BA4|nr:hypothetical protein [Streptomyces sp. or20]
MTIAPDASPTTILPYGPGNRWTFTYKETGFIQAQELALIYDASGSAPFTDEAHPAENTAEELWAAWAASVVDALHQEWPDRYRPGEVHINWGVTCPDEKTISEHAPHAHQHPGANPKYMTPAELDTHRYLYGHSAAGFHEDFLTHFTLPVHSVTGEPLNWLRLPVLDREWNPTTSNRGGFVQQATGWKPFPLQPTMDVRQVGAGAGLYVPPL